MKNRIMLLWAVIVGVPADILYLKYRDIVDMDLERYKEECPFKNKRILIFNYCLLLNKPFRNIFYFRVNKSLIIKNISKLLLPPLKTIEIMGRIEGGLRVSHNYSVIHPEMAGKNLYVGQGVTIGKGKPDDKGRIYPKLGNNVEIHSNAVVFGGITIGNNVKIGAGAVVNRDIPDFATVVGNPCRIIAKDINH